MRVRTIRKLGDAVLVGGFAVIMVGAAAQTPSSLPDAQIESNVLKALAGAPAMSSQNIQSSTVYGVVTLTGSVQNETLRSQAENLVARVDGVKKVVDELTLGDTPATAAPGDQSMQAQGEQPDAAQGNQPVLQSDGTYAPAPDGTGSAPPPNDAQPADGQNAPPPPQGNYPPQPTPSGRQPLGQSSAPDRSSGPIPGGQRAGVQVTVPAGAMLRIRINRGLDSNHIQPGASFDGTVLTDVVSDGMVAIPRGATVTGTVVDAKKTGTFKGEGELALQLNSLTLGGKNYPLNSDVWSRNGRDKTASTVNHTVGLGVVGALIGAVAGGGEGAAIGAGVGAGAGLAGSAASPRGQIIIPPESVLTFTTSTPETVSTVSEREMQRLSYAAGPAQPPPPPPRVRYYSPYYGYYYGPPR